MGRDYRGNNRFLNPAMAGSRKFKLESFIERS
jgi:hypothetical protein